MYSANHVFIVQLSTRVHLEISPEDGLALERETDCRH